MNITSRQLTAFVLIARHESFSRAAEQMYITQSGISIIVRDLESQLGFRLFDRTTRRVRVSEFGARFLPVATRCLSELEGAGNDVEPTMRPALRDCATSKTPGPSHRASAHEVA